MATSTVRDPRDIYKRLAQLLGGVQGDPALSRGEYHTVPGVGEVRTGNYEALMGDKKWDPMEVFKGYTQGQIPDWMQGKANLFSEGVSKGVMTDAERSQLARHWLLGEGVDPFYASAHANMPDWMKQFLQSVYGQYLKQNPVSGQPPPAH
jgi:hypothetical protein